MRNNETLFISLNKWQKMNSFASKILHLHSGLIWVHADALVAESKSEKQREKSTKVPFVLSNNP